MQNSQVPLTLGNFQFACYECEATSVRRRNRRETHHSPARNTTENTIRLSIADCPPKIQETISKRKSPMLPQFIAPMITSTSAILSSILSPFSAKTLFHILAANRIARRTRAAFGGNDILLRHRREIPDKISLCGKKIHYYEKYYFFK